MLTAEAEETERVVWPAEAPVQRAALAETGRVDAPAAMPSLNDVVPGASHLRSGERGEGRAIRHAHRSRSSSCVGEVLEALLSLLLMRPLQAGRQQQQQQQRSWRPQGRGKGRAREEDAVVGGGERGRRDHPDGEAGERQRLGAGVADLEGDGLGGGGGGAGGGHGADGGAAVGGDAVEALRGGAACRGGGIKRRRGGGEWQEEESGGAERGGAVEEGGRLEVGDYAAAFSPFSSDPQRSEGPPSADCIRSS